MIPEAKRDYSRASITAPENVPFERSHRVGELARLDVARELRCSKVHVYKVILGKVNGVSALPIIKLGRRKIVRRSALEAWKSANETGREQLGSTELNVA